MKIINYNNNRGIALIITVLMMSLIFFLSLYFLNFSMTEDRIAKSQSWGAKTYYLAEAGIAEMIWRLKNNETYKNNFETDPSWTQTFTRNNPFGANSGSYTVTITNSSLAHGQIESIGSINIGSTTSQRIVRTQVYRAIGESSLNDNGGYADGNIDISLSKVNFYNGSAHSNNNFIVNGNGTLINIDTDLNAVGNYIKAFASMVNIAGDTYAANYDPPGPAEQISMPAVDFDSADPNSYINIADVVYTENQFDNLMKNNQNLTLNNAITYVTGDVEIKGAQNLTINGLLVVGKDLELGDSECRGSRCGYNNITVNHASGTPSGIIAKRKIEFNRWSGNINISGIIYATDQLDILNIQVGKNFDILGGLISRKLTITSSWQPINITFDNEIVVTGLGSSTFSPIITVEHWEEEY